MRPTPVCLTFDHLGRGKDVGLNKWVRPAADAPEIITAIPRVLDLLEQVQARGTFYIEGWSALHHPDVVSDLVKRGHEIGLHGWVHERWTELTVSQQERVLRDGQAALRNAGAERIGFRASHGLIDAETFALLSELGFHHDSSRLRSETESLRPTRREGVPHVPFDWHFVDFWLLRKSEKHVASADLASEWMTAALDRHDAGEPIIVDIHPFFAALDDDIWQAIQDWTALITADPRFVWSSVEELADAMPHGVVPSAEHPTATWNDYLSTRGHDVTSAASATALVGGVSASVAQVGSLVVKQPLQQLSVSMEWLADTRRVMAEATAMRRAASLSPKIVDLDRESHVIVMEYVAGDTWKNLLMMGEIDISTAATVGRLLAEIHALDPAGLHDPERLEALRLDPYLRTAAARLPRHRDALVRIADRLRQSNSHLVHGDYSPKNILVDGAQVTVLDWEVAHAGDPMFDIAFLLSHLICKAVVMPEHRTALEQSAAAFLQAYRLTPDTWLDHVGAAEILGALLLGRTDGLSPLSYLNDEHRNQLRVLAGGLVEEGGPLWPL